MNENKARIYFEVVSVLRDVFEQALDEYWYIDEIDYEFIKAETADLLKDLKRIGGIK